MGVTAVKEHVFAEFRGSHGSPRIFNHGHSFTGNPLAAAAACASMELIRELDIPESLEATIAHFGAGLKKFDAYDIVGDIRHIGMIGALEIVRDRRTKKPFPAGDRFTFRLAQKALGHGLLIRPLGNVIYFIPPYTITAGQIDEMFEMLHSTIREILDESAA
jgi:adenosylmethionine-8-amino-7-oxononanoate aminotransferase